MITPHEAKVLNQSDRDLLSEIEKQIDRALRFYDGTSRISVDIQPGWPLMACGQIESAYRNAGWQVKRHDCMREGAFWQFNEAIHAN